MTYKFRIGLRPGWTLASDGGGTADVRLDDLLALLAAIDASGHIAGACRVCGWSYRHAWGVLRQFEQRFGTELLITRGRLGTELSPFAQRLVWANRRIQARLRPTMDSLASELQEELARLLPEDGPHLRLHASHGFAVEALMEHMKDGPPGLELRYRTAIEALAALRGGECDLAGFQIPLGPFEAPIMRRYTPWLDPDHMLLIHLAVRDAGMFVQPGNPKNIQGMSDLARPDIRFVNRQIGSSTRALISLMLSQAGIAEGDVQGYESNEFTHMAIAAHIASGMADTGVGVKTAASRFGLEFIPLVRERYFFAIHRTALHEPGMDALLRSMRSPEYVNFVGGLDGYDASRTGALQTLQEAFA